MLGCAHKPKTGTHADYEVYFRVGYGDDIPDCGRVTKSGREWRAYVVSSRLDYVEPHFFATQAEAVEWIQKNWCKP